MNINLIPKLAEVLEIIVLSSFSSLNYQEKSKKPVSTLLGPFFMVVNEMLTDEIIFNGTSLRTTNDQ